MLETPHTKCGALPLVHSECSARTRMWRRGNAVTHNHSRENISGLAKICSLKYGNKNS